MMRIHYRIYPAAYFGLPSDSRIVLPADGKERFVRAHSEDPLTRERVFHGSLSEYRSAEHVFEKKIECGEFKLHFLEDSLFVFGSQTAPEEINEAHSEVEHILRVLSVFCGERIRAEVLSVADESGRPLPIFVPRIGPIQRTTFYSFDGFSEQVQSSVDLSLLLDETGERALLYFEHACLLLEHADTLPSTSWHTAFSRAMAFLQLFKGLTTLIGDPSVDRDYQSRSLRIGLGRDYWRRRVKPLYAIRSDGDVAHHSHKSHNSSEFLDHYSRALEVFKEVLKAHLTALGQHSEA